MRKTGFRRIVVFALVAMLSLTTLMLAACGGGGGGSDQTIKVWASKDDKPFVEQWLDEFKDANEDFGYEIEVAEMGEDNASKALKDDKDAAADVVHIAHDQLGGLVEAGLTLELPSTHAIVDQINKDNSAYLAGLSKYKNKYYGIPDIQETYVMYYDKSIFTNADDVKSYESMKTIAKNGNMYTVAMQLKDNGYYSGAFFLSVGAKLYDGGDKTACTFNSNESYEMVKWIQGQYNKDNGIYVGDNPINTLGTGGSTRAAAYVSGPWDEAAVKAKLGANYGVTKLPTFDMGTGNDDTQLKSLGGVKMYVINSKVSGDRAEAAIKVAGYLASKEIQVKRFSARAHIPTHKDAVSDPAIQNSAIAKALFSQLSYLVAQPAIPEMGTNFYSPGHIKITALFANADGAFKPSDGSATDKLKIGLNELNAILVK